MNSIKFILHNLLRKPQQKFLLVLFSTMMIVCGKVNFTNLSRYSEISERTYRRQFSRSFNFIKGNAALIKQAIPATASQIIAIDCSFVPKSGRTTYGIEYFYNGSAGRAEKGLEISAIAVVDAETKQAYTLSVQQTPVASVSAETTRIDCQARDFTKLDFHFNASLMTLNLAKFDVAQAHQFPSPFVFSMASYKRKALNQHLLERFICLLGLNPTLIKSHPNFPMLCSYGVIGD